MVTNVGSQLGRTLLQIALKLTRVFTEPYFQRSWNCFTSSNVILKLSCQCGLSALPLPLQPFSNFRWPHSLVSMSHSSHLAKGSSRVSNYLFMAFSGCASSGRAMAQISFSPRQFCILQKWTLTAESIFQGYLVLGPENVHRLSF